MGEVVSGSGTSFLGSFLIIGILLSLVVVSDAGALLLPRRPNGRCHPMPAEVRLFRLVEPDLLAVASGSDRVKRPCAGLDSRSLALAVEPVDLAEGYLLSLLLLDLVGSWADLARVIHQSTHLAYIVRLALVLIAIDDGREETGGNARHRHLLQAGVSHGGGCAPRRNRTNHRDWVDDCASGAAVLAPRRVKL